MSAHTSPSLAFNSAANAAEGVRQVSVSTAANQAAATAAEVQYYRTLYKAALLNNVSTSNFVQALYNLGVRG
jgi:hypothetical protein